MRSLVRLVLVLLVLALVGLPLTAEAKRKKTFVYVHDNDAPQIWGFELARDGTLAEVTGSPFLPGFEGTNCGGNCDSLSYSKKRKMLFLGTADGLAVFSVGADGALTQVPGSPFDVGAVRLFGTSVLEKGKRVFVFAGDYGADQTRAWEIAKDGTATEVDGSPFAAGDGALGTAVAKKTLVVANQIGASISAYRIEKSGALTPADGAPFLVGDGMWTVQTTPDGKFAMVGSGAGPVHVMAVGKKTSVPAEITDSPFDLGLGDTENGMSLSPKRIGVAFSGSDTARVFTVARNGALTPLGGDVVDLGTNSVTGHDITTNGKILVVAAEGSEEVVSFAVDKKTGALTRIDSVDISAAAPGSIDDVLIVQR